MPSEEKLAKKKAKQQAIAEAGGVRPRKRKVRLAGGWRAGSKRQLDIYI